MGGRFQMRVKVREKEMGSKRVRERVREKKRGAKGKVEER